MKNIFLETREFVRGTARFHDLVYIISRGKTLQQEAIAHSSVIAVDRSQWADVVDTEWDSTAIAVARLPMEKMTLVGQDGDVVTYTGGTSVLEKIYPEPVMIRNARTISGHVFACGMKRQVYERVDEDRWIDLSAPSPAPGEKVGFEAVDGYTRNEVYAVGWNGEIWQFDGARWTSHNSPTNVILTAVCCTPNGIVYAAGQQGILIQGRNSSWEVVERQDEVNIDLWDLCWFEDNLYVATIATLYTLNGNRLVEVDFGEIPTPTCYSLTTAEGVLWSIGRDDVVSFDGRRWRSYD